MRGLIENIGRQLKEALPHAIVNNRPENYLARIMSYRTIQEAHDAGHSWIKIKGNGPEYPYSSAVITNDNVRIEGSHDVIIDAKDGDGIHINGASRCTIKDLKIIKRPNAAGPGNTGLVRIEGDKNSIYNVYVKSESTVGGYGFLFEGTASSNTIMNCVIEKSPGWAIYTNGSNHQYNILLNIKAYNSGGGVMLFNDSTSRNLLGNAIGHDTNDFGGGAPAYVAQLNAGANYNIIEGSLADGGNMAGNASGTNYSSAHITY